MIEVVGLAAAVEAADAALKSADVKLVGYELSKGGGMVVVKLTGNVSSVNMALEAAKNSASKVNKVCACKVIARMDESLDKVVYTKETVGYKEQSTVSYIDAVHEDSTDIHEEPKIAESVVEVQEEKQEELSEDDEEEHTENEKEKSDEVEFNQEEFNEEDELDGEEDSEIQEELSEIEEDIEQEDDSEVCNLCWDPECPRKKGDLRNRCIHYDDYEKRRNNR